MTTKKKSTGKATKKNKGLLSEILKDERDKEIAVLSEDNARCGREIVRQHDELNDVWKKLYDERDAYAQELNRRDCSHIESTRRNQELLDSKNIEITKLKDRLKSYASWVAGIKRLDLNMLPAESALVHVDTSLSLLYSSLTGATLEQAMQSLGYIEMVIGFETPKAVKFVLQLVKTDKLYGWKEGEEKQLEPRSTQIHAIKLLREQLNLGLREAKEITDTLHSGETREIEFSNLEGAEKVADALKRSGYFSVILVGR